MNRLCTRFRVPLADPNLAFLPIEEQDGHNYFTDMLFALRYAKENRRRMMEAMKETVAEFVPEVNFIRTIDIHHNYAACEEHFGRKVFVHRKGVTSAKLDEGVKSLRSDQFGKVRLAARPDGFFIFGRGGT